MKLRVRICKQTSKVDVVGPESTLEELMAHIRDVVLPGRGLSPDVTFALSLNGTELLADTGQKLSSCGVVPGDLIRVLLPAGAGDNDNDDDHASPGDAARPRAGPSAGARAPAAAAPPGDAAGRLLVEPATDAVTSGPPCCATPPDASGHRTPSTLSWEPMLCGEAGEGQAPHSLELLYRAAHVTCPTDVVMVAAHLLMLETGFTPQGAEVKPAEMPSGWRSSGGAYRLQYTHTLCERGVVTVVAVPMSPVLVIEGGRQRQHGGQSLRGPQQLRDGGVARSERPIGPLVVHARRSVPSHRLPMSSRSERGVCLHESQSTVASVQGPAGLPADRRHAGSVVPAGGVRPVRVASGVAPPGVAPAGRRLRGASVGRVSTPERRRRRRGALETSGAAGLQRSQMAGRDQLEGALQKFLQVPPQARLREPSVLPPPFHPPPHLQPGPRPLPAHPRHHRRRLRPPTGGLTSRRAAHASLRPRRPAPARRAAPAQRPPTPGRRRSAGRHPQRLRLTRETAASPWPRLPGARPFPIGCGVVAGFRIQEVFGRAIRARYKLKVRATRHSG
ncbi:F-box only protein 7 isoform X2 [Phyllopteryx taeniolatus]|nr:F-box only protein 7 isoform X2 [Phyllopteryx taeniolatus]XP_061618684.1 F-box only protein 7 isoform X2 [Phyllopteryx taeniolatus]